MKTNTREELLEKFSEELRNLITKYYVDDDLELHDLVGILECHKLAIVSAQFSTGALQSAINKVTDKVDMAEFLEQIKKHKDDDDESTGLSE